MSVLKLTFSVTIALLIGSAYCGAYAAEPSGYPSTWAVVPTSSAADGLADLLTAELSEVDGLALVERAEIKRILKEQELGASGLADPAHRVKLGKLLGADALLLVEHVAEVEIEDSDETLPASNRIRLVETRTGIRWMDLVDESNNFEQHLRRTVDELKDTLKKMRAGALRRHIGMMGVRSEAIGAELDRTAQTLGLLLEQDLGRLPGVVVMERAQLERLRKESDLTGVELELRSSTILLEGGLDRKDDQLKLTLRLTSLSRSKTLTRIVTGPSNDLPGLRQRAIESMAKLLRRGKAAKSSRDTRREAEKFFRHAVWIAAHRRWREAVPHYEAAYALNPSEKHRIALDICLTQSPGFDMNMRHRMMIRRAQIDLESLKRILAEHPDGERYDPKRVFKPWFILGDTRKLPKSVPKEARRPVEEVGRIQMQKFDLLAAAWRKHGKCIAPLLNKRLVRHLHSRPTYYYRGQIVAEVLAEFDEEVRSGRMKRSFRDANYMSFHQWTLEFNIKKFPLTPEQRQHIQDVLKKHEDPLLRIRGNYSPPYDRDGAIARTLLDDFFFALPADCYLLAADNPIQLRYLQYVQSAADHLRRLNKFDDYFDKMLTRLESDQKVQRLLIFPPGVVVCMFSVDLETKQTAKVVAQQRLDRIKKMLSGSKPAGAGADLLVRVFAHRMQGKSLLGPGKNYLPPAPAPLPKPPAAIDPWNQFKSTPIPYVRTLSVDFHLMRIFVDHASKALHGREELVLFWYNQTKYIKDRNRDRIDIRVTRLRKPGGELQSIARYEGGFPGVGRVAIAPNAVYVIEDTAVLKLADGKATRLKLDPPLPKKTKVVSQWFSGHIYLALEGHSSRSRDNFGALARYDPTTQKIEMLASSKVATARHGLDHCTPYIIHTLSADFERKCLWLSVDAQRYSAPQRGVWRYRPATGKFDQVYQGRLVSAAPGADGLLIRTRPRNDKIEYDMLKLDYSTGQTRPLGKWRVSGSLRHEPLTFNVGQYHVLRSGDIFDPFHRKFPRPKTASWNRVVDYYQDGFVATGADSAKAQLWYVHPTKVTAPEK